MLFVNAHPFILSLFCCCEPFLFLSNNNLARKNVDMRERLKCDVRVTVLQHIDQILIKVKEKKSISLYIN